MGVGTDVERALVWSNLERSSDVRWDAGHTHGSGGAGGIFAGAACFTDRSDVGAKDELRLAQEKWVRA